MDVIMPQLGETVLEGSVAIWYKNVGDKVQADEALFDVETDKVTSEIPAPISGVLTQILVETGATVKVGTVLAVIEAEGSAAAAKPMPAVTAMPTQAPTKAASTSVHSEQSRTQPLTRTSSEHPPLSPVVRRLLGENDLTAEQVSGTGRNGRITREDVLACLESATRSSVLVAPVAARVLAASPAIAAISAKVGVESSPITVVAVAVGNDDLVVPLNKIRRATASHMVRSLATSPHALQAVEVDYSAVDKARKAIGEDWKKREGYSLTYLPFIARAVCESISKYPYINATFSNNELIVHKRLHLGIAVDVNFDGLLATVVRDAHFRNLRGMAAEISRLASAARSSQLKPDELSGGTYTISNSGSFGTLFSTSIINQPQAAILSADGIRKKPVVIEGVDGDVIAIRPIGILTQSFDHRAFDGAYSASFLRHLKDCVEGRDWLGEL